VGGQDFDMIVLVDRPWTGGSGNGDGWATSVQMKFGYNEITSFVKG
jgi:hypothetical protein